jgi:dihydrofolate reductase
MGKLVVTEFLSIDGVMEAPGGEPGYRHTAWVTRFPDVGQFENKFEEVLEHEALLIGRVTYESFAGAWPFRDGPFADRMNTMPKFVASTTLKDPEWSNTTVLEGDTMTAVQTLKAQLAGDILVTGSRTLVQGLAAADLVDEYRLMIFPIVLGSGFRLWADTVDATTLRLVGTRAFGDVVVLNTYARVRD